MFKKQSFLTCINVILLIVFIAIFSASAEIKVFEKAVEEIVGRDQSQEQMEARLAVQQGLFTFGGKPDLDHWKQINGLLQNDCFVVQIKCHEKLDILRRLNSTGLNGSTLFPGADGIGRSLEGFARAWHLKPRPSQF